MYRCLEAHFILYLSLHKEYIQALVNENPLIEKDLREGIINATYQDIQEKTEIKKYHEEVKTLLNNMNIVGLRNNFECHLSNQSTFYCNYMKLFERLLLFIRASRQQCWQLHLASLHELCPYFFVFDMLNYARLTPVYLSQMYELKTRDVSTWNILEQGNFSVNKSKVPFSAIGTDHGIEQENRAIKVLGGIKGIANNQQALDEFFLTASEISNIIEHFCDEFDIKDKQGHKRDKHYQLTGSKNFRINENIKKLEGVFQEYEVKFDQSKAPDVYNVLTKKVLPHKVTETFLSLKRIGQLKYDKFVKERLLGDTSIWDPLSKEKLPTFVNNNCVTTVTVNKQLINLKEERKLMSRFLIARPDLVLTSTYHITLAFMSFLLYRDRYLHQMDHFIKLTINQLLLEISFNS